MRDRTTRDLIWIASLWLVLGILGEVAANYALNTWYPEMFSQQGGVTAGAFAFLLRIVVPGAILITIILVYSAIRFRVPESDTRDSPAQYRFGRFFAWTWLGLSAALNILFIIYPGATGLLALANYQAAATSPLQVDVTAMQWQWNFSYPQYNLMNQSELVLPVNTPVKFMLQSQDVVHSFWIPAFGLKEDVIPGQTRELYITPNKMISTRVDPLARVQCAEICGIGHAQMRAVVRVVSQADFQQWVKQQKQPPGGMGMIMQSDMVSINRYQFNRTGGQPWQ